LLAPARTTSADAALAALLLYVTNPHAPPWRGGRSLAATFPLTMRIDLAHGVHEVDIVRERDGGYVAAVEGRSSVSRSTNSAAMRSASAPTA
jgi:geranyl-CoA carboxylase alpha subunit